MKTITQKTVATATLNFRKFKVALNPMYRIFETLPKVASYHAYQKLII